MKKDWRERAREDSRGNNGKGEREELGGEEKKIERAREREGVGKTISMHTWLGGFFMKFWS